MIKLKYQDILKKVEDKTKLSNQEIESKINKKLEELSGLVSKEGAAYIIANELGVKLVPDLTQKIKIKEILPGMRQVQTVGKVINKTEIREFNSKDKKGKVASVLIGDETATIRLVFWHDKTSTINNIKQGDILKIRDCYARENNGFVELHANDRTQVIINPDDEKIENVAEPVKREIQRKKINQLNQYDNAELLGTVVQVFNPNFYEVCPECSTRMRKDQNNLFVCPEHKAVTPTYNIAVNFVLDDGTETIRVACFRDVALTLLSLNKDQLDSLKNNLEAIEKAKKEVLGAIVKVSGRVVKNDFSQNLDFYANSINTNPDPKKELELLNKEGY